MKNRRLNESFATVSASLNIRPSTRLNVGENASLYSNAFTAPEDNNLRNLLEVTGPASVDEVIGNNAFRLLIPISNANIAKYVYDWLYENTNIASDDVIETYIAHGLVDLAKKASNEMANLDDEADYDNLAYETDRDNAMIESMKTRNYKRPLNEEEDLDLENAPEMSDDVDAYDDIMGYAKFNISPDEAQNLPFLKKGQVGIIYYPDDAFVSSENEEIARAEEYLGDAAQSVLVVDESSDTLPLCNWITEASLAYDDKMYCVMVIVNQEDIATVADFFEDPEMFEVDPIVAIYDGSAIYASLSNQSNEPVGKPSEILSEIFGDLDIETSDGINNMDDYEDMDNESVQDVEDEIENEMYNESVSSRFAKYRKLYESALFEEDDETLNEKGDKPTEDDFADIFGGGSDSEGDDAKDDNTDSESDDKEPDNGEESAEDDEDVPMTAVLLTVKKDDADKCKDELVDAGIPEDDIEIIEGEDDDDEAKVKVDANSVKELKDYLSGKGIDLEEKLGGEIIDDDDESSDDSEEDSDSSDDKEKSDGGEDDFADMDFGDLFGDDEESAD